MLSPRILALALALATLTAALYGLAGCRRTTHHLAVSRRARRPLLALVPSSGGGEQQELLERCFAASCPGAASAEPGDASPGSLADLPLVCAPWASPLPGVVQVLRIFDPALIHTFESLARDAGGPRLFAHFESAATPTDSPYRALASPGVLTELRDVRRLRSGGEPEL